MDSWKSGLRFRNRLPATSGFIAHNCPVALWRRRCISVPMEDSEMRTGPFANGAQRMDTDFLVVAGRFTAIGRRAGITMHQRYARMFSISLMKQKARPKPLINGWADCSVG